MNRLLVLFSLLAAPCWASEVVLQRKIIQAESMLREVSIKAQKIDDGSPLGTAIYSDHAKTFECFSLGVKLGFERGVSHLDLPHSRNFAENISSTDAGGLKILQATTQRFVEELRSAKLLDVSKAATVWNFNCSGQYKISSKLNIPSKESAFYSISSDGAGLYIHGTINRGYAGRLKSIVDQHEKIRTIHLGSGGGFVDEAIAAGYVIRSKGLATQLSGYCHSACPLVFIGGVERKVFRPYFGLGFHQISLDGFAIPQADPAYMRVRNYVEHMGVNAEYVLKKMLSSQPDGMTIWNPVRSDSLDKSACDARVVTFVQNICY
jgi:hypothetical protein